MLITNTWPLQRRFIMSMVYPYPIGRFVLHFPDKVNMLTLKDGSIIRQQTLKEISNRLLKITKMLTRRGKVYSTRTKKQHQIYAKSTK